VKLGSSRTSYVQWSDRFPKMPFYLEAGTIIDVETIPLRSVEDLCMSGSISQGSLNVAAATGSTCSMRSVPSERPEAAGFDYDGTPEEASRSMRVAPARPHDGSAGYL
jgi:hypothetical protein